VVVLLWHDQQRQLSLKLNASDDTGAWIYYPGKSVGSLLMLDFSNPLTQGTSGPEDFALTILCPWARGEDPAPQ
jgi:hypothetical protein